MRSFSFKERDNILNALSSQVYDILIIGGGVTGAGIALDAVTRGLKTALVEKSDFASGTSSRSTKLIHGGLRYLKQLEFALVREVGSERAVVHKLAPYLVIPEKMLLPLRERRGYNSMLASIGLMLYDWLAGVIPKDRRRMLTRRQTLRREPLLKKDQVKGGALYAEYRTDDARLTIEIIKKAYELGADIVNYAEVTDLITHDNRVAGVKVDDKLTHQPIDIKSRVVINASGPWVDQIRKIDNSRKGKRLHLTKGIHIVFSYDKFPVKQSVYFDIQDGRMIFAIPRGRTTYVGTTDTTYEQRPEDVQTSLDDVDYLLQGINDNFPTVQLGRSDVESCWAGLRPLIHEEGKSTSELSRKDEIFISPSGLISIAGGKLTGYRKMAERVVDQVVKEHFRGRKVKDCSTHLIRLGDGKFSNHKQVKVYTRKLLIKVRSIGLDEQTASYLVSLYGARAEVVLNEMDKFQEKDAALNLLLSELGYTVNNEMVTSSLDFFNRRTGRQYFDIESVFKYKDVISIQLAKLLNWSDEKLIADQKELEIELSKSSLFH